MNKIPVNTKKYLTQRIKLSEKFYNYMNTENQNVFHNPVSYFQDKGSLFTAYVDRTFRTMPAPAQ